MNNVNTKNQISEILELENHTNKLNQILDAGNKVFNRFTKNKEIGDPNALTDKDLDKMEVTLFNAIRLAGALSGTRHEIQQKLNDYYVKTYASSPAIGHKLYLDHYFSLLKPYDRVKNKLWNYFFTIQEFRGNKY